jgi:hypothetical protein
VEVANTLAYYDRASITVESFMVQAPGVSLLTQYWYPIHSLLTVKLTKEACVKGDIQWLKMEVLQMNFTLNQGLNPWRQNPNW